jgi:hypothetical protein
MQDHRILFYFFEFSSHKIQYILQVFQNTFFHQLLAFEIQMNCEDILLKINKNKFINIIIFFKLLQKI